MNIDFDYLARVMALVDAAKIHALEIQEGEKSIKIVKSGEACSASLSQSVPADKAEGVPEAVKESVVEAIKGDEGHQILSPMFGTFYRKSSPSMPNFTEVGHQVQEGDTLCIVEAMKIMHEVKAGKAGTVQAILVTEGEMVEADTPLFVLV
ncbi:MAG: acetyl-CoA carboxylase biotin carboxyl carrier protein [Moraxella sp.]|nr:acetyl-CoA carboxylase biotin carboxyl carrier protein [Moraxella sp.]